MKYFACDYHEGCCDAVMQALVETNGVSTPGYGVDAYCERARDRICSYLGDFCGEIHFVVGGTQANTTVIAGALAPYQGVICAETGHINVHETGAIEATGHKCIAVAADSLGRIDLSAAEQLLEEHFSHGGNEHEVMPGMIYISNTTELGGIYQKSDLEALRALCDRYEMVLFLDGARLGYALETPENDLTLSDLARLCDVFTLGGTKQGLLFGEAIIISRPDRFPRFRYMIKRQGGMLAKGRLLGVQFDAILKDDLYFSMARRAVMLARTLREALEEMGVITEIDSPSNQQFVRFPSSLFAELEKEYCFEVSKRSEEGVSVRICTSWTTTEEDIAGLIEAVRRLC